MFERQFPDGALEKPSRDTYSSYECINLNTRYFTSRKEDATTSALPILRDIDPQGHLFALQGDKYFYGPENEVQYFSGQCTTGSKDIKE